MLTMLLLKILPNTSPTVEIFQKTPPLWKFKLSFRHFFKYFGPTEPPASQPQEILIPSVGGVFGLHKVCSHIMP